MTRVVLALPLFLCAALSSAADPVIKVGVIGLDNY